MYNMRKRGFAQRLTKCPVQVACSSSYIFHLDFKRKHSSNRVSLPITR